MREAVPLPSPAISFRGLDPSPVIRALIERRTAALSRFGPVQGCRVMVDAPQKPTRSARSVRVHVVLSVPGPDISVSREVAEQRPQHDLRLAVAHAFDAAEDMLKRQQGKRAPADANRHPPVLHGRITAIDGAGAVLHGDDGRDYALSPEALTAGRWNGLMPGVRLRFRPATGDSGLQATDAGPV